MTKSKTPVKPPSKAQKSTAGHGLATGKLSKAETRSQSGRIEPEASATKKADIKKVAKAMASGRKK